MKKIIPVSMTKPLMNYKAILFDLDGTLYVQPVLRLHMGLKLFSHYLLHPRMVKELLILYHYRKIREHWALISKDCFSADPDTKLEVLQYTVTAKKLSVSPDRVQKTVEFWLHLAPLSLLPRYLDHHLAGLIQELRTRGLFTAVYSDYPAADKLEALGITMDAVFSSDTLGCMKPDPAGISAILSSLSLSPKQVLMIGDRYEKDGLSAKNIGMDYLILPKSMPKRRLLYRTLRKQLYSLT